MSRREEGAMFACKITDADYLRAFASEQPDEVKVGQWWMRASDGTELPIKRVRDVGPLGTLYDLGSDTLTVIVGARTLREDWVCTDAPDNVRQIAREDR